MVENIGNSNEELAVDLPNEDLVGGQFGYSQLFDHFQFNNQDKMNKDMVGKLEYIWNYLAQMATMFNTTPIQELSRIELNLKNVLYVDLLNSVYQYVRIQRDIEDSHAELSTLQR